MVCPKCGNKNAQCIIGNYYKCPSCDQKTTSVTPAGQIHYAFSQRNLTIGAEDEIYTFRLSIDSSQPSDRAKHKGYNYTFKVEVLGPGKSKQTRIRVLERLISVHIHNNFQPIP